jgi:predicted ABC-type ATPase
MLQEMDGCVAARESFAFETTLAGRVYLRHIKNWRELGYHVSLFFLKLTFAEAAIERVAERVLQGGHNIPEHVIRRRFKLGWDNLENHYQNAVDDWAVYDNSESELLLIDWKPQI